MLLAAVPQTSDATAAVDGGNATVVLDAVNKLTDHMKDLKTSFDDHRAATNKEIEDLKATVKEQGETITKYGEAIAKQQAYIERLDRKERECNLVILGVPEGNESFEGATNDPDKVKKVWEAAQITCGVKSIRRLGNPDRDRRPMLVEVYSKTDRDAAYHKAKSLKEKDRYKKVFIKKDTHPSVRAEWTRLHEVVKIEKDRPENAGCSISLDYKERKVYKDGVVIDKWSMQGF